MTLELLEKLEELEKELQEFREISEEIKNKQSEIGAEDGTSLYLGQTSQERI